jgi:hypothetical protein
MGASIAGGLFAHSLALLSDAGHMLADAGLALALVAQRVATPAHALPDRLAPGGDAGRLHQRDLRRRFGMGHRRGGGALA